VEKTGWGHVFPTPNCERHCHLPAIIQRSGLGYCGRVIISNVCLAIVENKRLSGLSAQYGGVIVTAAQAKRWHLSPMWGATVHELVGKGNSHRHSAV